MIYDDYFWTELSYERWAFVAPSGEILTKVTYNNVDKTYLTEDREFMTLAAAKLFAIAVLKRLGKMDDDDEEEADESLRSL